MSENGGEFQVNVWTTAFQQYPDIVTGPQGEFVVVWSSDGSTGSDLDGMSVQARRYSADGTPLGGEFQVNTYTSGVQRYPAVAPSPGGAFVVVWESNGSSFTDVIGLSMQAQRYAANGLPLGGQFQVNTYTLGDQRYPDVAADGQGNFAVVWRSSESGGTDHQGFSVHAQRLAADGSPLGVELQVNTYTTDDQDRPAVAMDSAGNFVVVWQSTGSSGPDTSGRSVRAQRYAANGSALGGEFQVNTYSTFDQSYPAIAANAQGNFVVVWQGGGSGGTDQLGWSIHAQRFASNGTPLGGELQVNTYTPDAQQWPAVAIDDAGSFIVTWTSLGSAGSDTSSFSVQGQRYRPGGTPLGGEFQVNTYTTSYQWTPAVAATALGDFVVAWHSWGSSGTDNDAMSVQAQRFDGLFRDGFESGTTARWSSVTP